MTPEDSRKSARVPRFRLGIRLKLVLLLLTFGIVPVACVGGFVASEADTLRAVTTARLTEQADAINDIIDHTLFERYGDVQALALNTAAYDAANWARPDGNNPLIRVINDYVRDSRIYKMSMLVSPAGKVLAVNTADGEGKPIDTSWLYGENFSKAEWFVKVGKGEFLKGKHGLTGTVVEPPAQSPLIQRAYPGEDGFSIGFAAPVHDLQGKSVGVWVNFADFGLVERAITKAYDRLAASGMPGAELTLLDPVGRILVDYDPSQTGRPAYKRDFKTIFKVNLVTNKSPAAVYAIAGGRGAVTSIHSRRHIEIVNGYAHSVGTDDFPGLGWSMLVRAPVQEGFATINHIVGMLWLVIAAALVVTVLLGWWIGRRTVRPIAALRDAMARLARNDTDVAVPGTAGHDELGDMARAVDVLKQAIVARNQLEAETKMQRETAEAERARREATTAEAAASQAEVVSALSAGLDRMAAGDLTARVQDELDPAYEALRVNFNAMAEHLQQLVVSITENADTIRAGTNEIAQASDDLSRRTEQQAASLEQTAAALDEITGAVRRTAEGAGKAQASVAAARLDAERSGKVVHDAVAAMDAIEDSSRRIGQIIGVIDEIAFQTNLLALNAGVEAARAGDAGRGFAVVASEVRALAQRSAEAAKEIKTLIAASAQQVGAGVQLVGQTGQALDRIVNQVGAIDGIVNDIAASAKEQATGLQEVNTGVTQMDRATQQNAAMVEQSTAAVRSLADQTEELVRIAGQFRTGPTTGPERKPPERTHPATARHPAPKRQLHLVGSNGAAGDWKEF